MNLYTSCENRKIITLIKLSINFWAASTGKMRCVASLTSNIPSNLVKLQHDRLML